MWQWIKSLFGKQDRRYLYGRVITKRKHFPKCIRHILCLKGISIGNCIDTEQPIDRFHYGHAHSYSHDACRGWLCLSDPIFLDDELCLLHEVAHLIVGSNKVPDHGELWRTTLVAIGGQYTPHPTRQGGMSADYSLVETVEDDERLHCEIRRELERTGR